MSTPEQLIPDSEIRGRESFRQPEISGGLQAPVEQEAKPEVVAAQPAPVLEERKDIPETKAPLAEAAPNSAVTDFLDGKITEGQLEDLKGSGRLSAADLVNGLLRSRGK